MNRRTRLAAGAALALAPLARPALADALDSIRARK